MKKYLLLIIALLGLMVATSLSSCKKDDPIDSIVGKWTCTERFYQANDTYEFRKNGTFEHTYQVTGSWGNNFTPYSGNYILFGSILTLSYNGYNDIYIVYNGGDYMIITDEDGDSYTYYRE